MKNYSWGDPAVGLGNELFSNSDTSRRDFLKAFASAGAVAMLPTAALMAQRARPGTGPARIDVHHHYQQPGRSGGYSNWTAEKSIEQMDKYGIATAILSAGGYGGEVYTGTEAGRTNARKYNEFAAKVVSDHPQRFGFLAVIPFPDAEGSLREIEYSFETLKADGVGILSSIGDSWPGDPAFLPAFQELNRRKAVAFIHPFVHKCCRNLIPGGAASIEFDFDTTRAVTNLLYSGTLSQLPDIRYIINHSGAAIPALAGRIKDRVPGASTYLGSGNKLTNRDGKTDKIPNGVFYEFRKLYYECAHAAYPAAMSALTKLVPTSQLLFGTDYPAEDPDITLSELVKNGLSPEALRALNRGNAERLFPRLKS